MLLPHWLLYRWKCLHRYVHLSLHKKINQRSLACTPFCTGCSSAATDACYSCSPSAIPVLSLSPTGTCEPNCPAGTYASDLYCVPCDAACVECTDSGNTNCVTAAGCQPGYFQQPPVPSTNCFTSCPAFYYGDSTDNTCKSCHTYCKVCTGPTVNVCSQCAPGYYLLGASTCVPASGCTPGTYPDSITSTCASKSPYSLLY